MKKQILFCVFLFFLFNKLEAQEFSFQMYFEDAEGNKDTLTIGFDFYGSRDTINPGFGEENIADVPFDDVFDVRITNYQDIRLAGSQYDLFHSKNKVVKYFCDRTFDYNWHNNMPFVNVDIYAEHWPVTAKWDSTLFIEQCVSGSWFGGNYYGYHGGIHHSNLGWVILKNVSEISFTKNYPDDIENDDTYEWQPNYYIDDSGKIISTFWANFVDSTLFYPNNVHSVHLENKIVLYPNPASNKFSILNNSRSNEINKIVIYDINGRKCKEIEYNQYVDISDLTNGVFMVKIIFRNREFIWKKILKQS